MCCALLPLNATAHFSHSNSKPPLSEVKMNLSRSCSYSRVAKEDPDEKKHRRAQFLINKELQRADTIRRPRRSTQRLAISRLKIKVGSRLRKTAHYTVSVARSKLCVYKKILEQLKLWKKGTRGRDADVVMQIAPLFSLEVDY